MEQHFGSGMDGRGARKRGRSLHRWARAGLSWRVGVVAPALRGAGTALFARDHGLLGQRHGWTAVLCGERTGRSGPDPDVGGTNRAAPLGRSARTTHPGTVGSKSVPPPLYHRL